MSRTPFDILAFLGRHLGSKKHAKSSKNGIRCLECTVFLGRTCVLPRRPLGHRYLCRRRHTRTLHTIDSVDRTSYYSAGTYVDCTDAEIVGTAVRTRVVRVNFPAVAVGCSSVAAGTVLVVGIVDDGCRWSVVGTLFAVGVAADAFASHVVARCTTTGLLSASLQPPFVLSRLASLQSPFVSSHLGTRDRCAPVHPPSFLLRCPAVPDFFSEIRAP